MANNAIPDSIIMNMICRSFGPPVELNDPNVRSTEVTSGLSCLTSKNTVRILNTIKLVTRAFTTIDTAKPVRSRGGLKDSPSLIVIALSAAAIQVAKGDKLKSAYQMKTPIYSLTYVCDCQKGRNNNHDLIIFIPHDPTTVDL